MRVRISFGTFIPTDLNILSIQFALLCDALYFNKILIHSQHYMFLLFLKNQHHYLHYR